MRILSKAKDGGHDSPVDAYFLIEIKSLFSMALLKFNKGTRNNYHNHAFHALTWFIKGDLCEISINSESKYWYKRSWFPKLTKRDKMHKVLALKDSWCFTIRGPWNKTWKEYNPINKEEITFTHGRKIIPPNRLACGDITKTGKHTNWICRLIDRGLSEQN